MLENTEAIVDLKKLLIGVQLPLDRASAYKQVLDDRARELGLCGLFTV